MARDLAHCLRALIVTLAMALGPAGQAVVGGAAQAAETQTPGQADMPAPGQDVGVATLKSAQLAAMLENKNFFFVNVHIPYEGEIRNTDAIIAFDQIADNLDKLPSDKGTKIVLYCRSGRMSEIAGKELMRLGYTQVSHLSGGMIDWKNSGYEIIEK